MAPLFGCATLTFINTPTAGLTEAKVKKTLTTNTTNWQHTLIQHEGILTYFNTNKSVTIDKVCTHGKWERIQTQNSLSDIFIRLIANPLYATATVNVNCISESANFAHRTKKTTDDPPKALNTPQPLGL